MKLFFVECPSCKAKLKIFVERTVLAEPIRGSYEDKVTVETDTQTRLEA